jgi:hypothetical protein
LERSKLLTIGHRIVLRSLPYRADGLLRYGACRWSLEISSQLALQRCIRHLYIDRNQLIPKLTAACTESMGLCVNQESNLGEIAKSSLSGSGSDQTKSAIGPSWGISASGKRKLFQKQRS